MYIGAIIFADFRRFSWRNERKCVILQADFIYKFVQWNMNKYEIPFVNACIKAFGQKFALSRETAYAYLKKYSGVAFLIEFYDVEHLQSIEDTVDDLVLLCQKNGGQLA